jgi:aminoglycoside 3-N-acetyltransferase
VVKDQDSWQLRPEVTAETLADALRRLGLNDGDVVLVHSSLSRLGNVRGGAEMVIDALLEAVGPAGTVLFPTLTGTEGDGPDSPPIVDVRLTPCWTGRIPETARKRPEARRSLHPTHSIAVFGAGAERYAAGHEASATPCDTHSPYYRLITEGGRILLLGDVTQDSNTSFHCLEELAEVPYHLQPEPTDGIVIDAGGGRHVVRNQLHHWGWARDFPKVDGPLRSAGAMRSGRVGQSTSHLIAARSFADTLLPLLRQDPLYLLSQGARRAFRNTEVDHHPRFL